MDEHHASFAAHARRFYKLYRLAESNKIFIIKVKLPNPFSKSDVPRYDDFLAQHQIIEYQMMLNRVHPGKGRAYTWFEADSHCTWHVWAFDQTDGDAAMQFKLTF